MANEKKEQESGVWTYIFDFDNERICCACGERNHHGYLLVESVDEKKHFVFICHPCSESLADAVIEDWSGK